MTIARRNARAALAALTAFTATVAAASLSVLAAGPASAAPAGAAQGMTLKLKPSSGSNYGTDTATLSWTAPSACEGQEVDTFIYAGTGTWDANAINTAEGNNGNQTTYYIFASVHPVPTPASGSAGWPNVSGDSFGGYEAVGTGGNPVQTYGSTTLLEQALGSGNYTIGIACVNGTTFQPILASGNPIGTTIEVTLGSTGSWGVTTSKAVGTSVALTGSGTAGKLGHTVSLTAVVTASNHTVPAGTVNFYASGSATGTPLNGATPVPVNSKGQAKYSGPSGYAADLQGAQTYTAAFTPANPSAYLATSKFANVDLIADDVTITVTAREDTKTPEALDLKATGKATPTSLNSLAAAVKGRYGVDFVLDGKILQVYLKPIGVAPFRFSKSGVASDMATDVKAGRHVVTALFENPANGTAGPAQGFAVTVNTVHVKTVAFIRPGSPLISGKPVVGDKLRVKPGLWEPAGVHLAYQWYAGSTKIKGATGRTLLLRKAQLGKKIKVEVTGSLKGAKNKSVFSRATAPVAKAR
jgi:hypothetical protein